MLRPCVILMVDDDDNDVFVARRAFTEIDVRCKFEVLKNGREVIQYLSGEGEYANRAKYPLPMMMLLDLKMPIMDGFEVLAWLRARPGLKVIPTIVFSSSDLPEDITRAYALGANSFMTKSATYHGLLERFQTLSQYWLEHCQCPTISDLADGSAAA